MALSGSSRLEKLFSICKKSSLITEEIVEACGLIGELNDKHLLESSFDMPGIDGKTLLMLAAMGGYEEIINELIRIGVNLEVNNPELGNTPLILAAGREHKVVVKQLLAAGADIAAINASGNNALLHAIDKKCFGAIPELIEAKVNVNVVNGKGDTALSRFGNYCGSKVTCPCCKAGATHLKEAKFVDMHGQPLVLSPRKGVDLNVLSQLLQAGAVTKKWAALSSLGYSLATHPNPDHLQFLYCVDNVLKQIRASKVSLSPAERDACDYDILEAHVKKIDRPTNPYLSGNLFQPTKVIDEKSSEPKRRDRYCC